MKRQKTFLGFLQSSVENEVEKVLERYSLLNSPDKLAPLRWEREQL